MARWFKGKEGGKAPPEALTLQIALKFGMSPADVENLDLYWYNRMAIWLKTEGDADKLP